MNNNNSQLAIKIYNEYIGATTHGQKDKIRWKENYQYYWDVNPELGQGSVPSQVVAAITNQGRKVRSHNMIKPTLDTVAGTLSKNRYDIDFVPVNSLKTSLIDILKDKMYSEKDMCQWDISLSDLILHGCIYRGDYEMFINREYDEPMIAFRTRQPLSVTYDPYWKSNRSKDCRKCWVDSYLTAREIVEKYTDKTADIMRCLCESKGISYKDELIINAASRDIHDDELNGEEYGTNRGVIGYIPDEDEVWGSLYHVISEYKMVKISKWRTFAISPESEQKIYVPDEIESAEEKFEWIATNVPEYSPDAIFEEEHTEDKQICTTICPTLHPDLVLDRNFTEVQCGRLQFFPWSVSHLNGEWAGLVDWVKGTQEQINNLLDMINNKNITEGSGGSQFIDPDMFESIEEMNNYIQNRNDPAAVFRLKSRALLKNPNGPAIPTAKSQMSSDLTTQLSTLIDVVWPRISKVSPASQGMAEGSNESGYLFRLKKMQSELQQVTINDSFRNWWNEVIEAYYWQSSEMYGDQKERVFYSPKYDTPLKINERKIDEYGREYIANDFSALKSIRHKIIVKESSDSPSKKFEVVMVNSEAISKMPPNMPLTIALLASEVAKNIADYDTEQREKIDYYASLELQLIEQDIRTKIAVSQQQEMQAKMGMQQMASAPQQPSQLPQQAMNTIKAIQGPQTGPQEQIEPIPQGEVANVG